MDQDSRVILVSKEVPQEVSLAGGEFNGNFVHLYSEKLRRYLIKNKIWYRTTTETKLMLARELRVGSFLEKKPSSKRF